MLKRGPLSQAEHDQRVEAGRASAAARHRAETAPSVAQGSTGAPSARAIALFRAGQSRSGTGGGKIWDTRTTEAPKGAMNARVTFHLPKAYMSAQPDARIPGGHKLLASTLGAKEGEHRDLVLTNPGQIAEALRHPEMRAIVGNVVSVIRDHQKGTIERGTTRKMIPEGTSPATVVKAYKHAALRAAHQAGLFDYDTKMDETAKAEMLPLRRFMFFANRRVFDHLNQAGLKGKWTPFRDEFGQLYRQKKFGKPTGVERMRMRPHDLMKISLIGDLDDLAKSAEIPDQPQARVIPGEPKVERWAHFSHMGGYSSSPHGNRLVNKDKALEELALISIERAKRGQQIPEPPGGVPPIASAHQHLREAAVAVERHFGIGGMTKRQSDGTFLVKADVGSALGKSDDIGFDLGGLNMDPKRQLNRAMHPRVRRRILRLRLNPQRNLRRVLSGGITRQNRWMLGSTPSYNLGKLLKKDGGPRIPPGADQHLRPRGGVPAECCSANGALMEYSARGAIMAKRSIEEKLDRLQARRDPLGMRAAVARVAKPTDGQIEAGNYRKGHITLGGLPITLESVKGSIRRGVNKATGKPWAVKLPAHYGYIKQTTGNDGDHLDVYVGPHHHDAHGRAVHVVNQHDLGTGRFDEHKAFLGFRDRAHAIQTYDAGFSDGRGPERRKSVHTLTFEDFRKWIGGNDTTKPLKKGLIGSAAKAGVEFGRRHRFATGIGGGIGAGLGIPMATEEYNRHPAVRAIAGAAVAGGGAALLSRHLQVGRVLRSSRSLYDGGLADVVREHHRVLSGGTPNPLQEAQAHAAFRAGKKTALQQAKSQRQAGKAAIRTRRTPVALAAIAGAGALGLHRKHYTMPPDYQVDSQQQ